MAIVTLKERDAIAVKKRVDALSRVKVHLADVGRQYGGQFLLFGSVSRGTSAWTVTSTSSQTFR